MDIDRLAASLSRAFIKMRACFMVNFEGLGINGMPRQAIIKSGI